MTQELTLRQLQEICITENKTAEIHRIGRDFIVIKLLDKKLEVK